MCFAQIAFGSYIAVYADRELGLTEGAFTLRSTVEADPITADFFGRTMIDGIYLGMNAAIAVVLKEWSDIGRKALNPFTRVPNQIGHTGPIGRCMSDPEIAKRLRLIPLTGPARGSSPAKWGVIDAPRAIYQPQHTVEIAYGNTERLLALVFQLLPLRVNGGITNPAFSSVTTDNQLYHYTIDSNVNAPGGTAP